MHDIPLRCRIAVCVLAGIGGIVLSPAAMRAQSPDPLASAHISPTLYFPSAAAEEADRTLLHQRVPQAVQQIAGAASTADLVRALRETETLQAALQLHLAYLKVQALENRRDEDRTAYMAVSADESLLEDAIDARLLKVPPAEIPSMGAYSYLATSVQQDAAHTLPAATEHYRSVVTQPFEGTIAGEYDRLDDTVGSFAGIDSPDATVRHAAIAKRNAAYDALAPQEATLLGSLVFVENADSKAQGYTNAAQRKYESLGFSDAEVEATLNAVRAQGSAYREYEHLLAERAAAKLHVAQADSQEAKMVATTAPPISLTEARSWILESFQPLGQDYTQRFSALLNPANGRLDLSGGTHRTSTNTSISAYNAPTALYDSGYDGSLGDVSKLAHEGGHAIHRELMNAAGIPIYQREGPHFLFEGYAIFNEILLLQHAVDVATTRPQKEHALERLLAKVSLELFTSAEETTFERSLYTHSTDASLLTREQIDADFRASLQPYEDWPMSDVGQSRGWMRKSLVFEDPLYLVNYLYASMVAVALYDKSQHNPQFAQQYEALLSKGFPAPPQTLLDTMGIRLDDPRLVSAAADFIRTRTAELRRLYAEDAAAR